MGIEAFPPKSIIYRHLVKSYLSTYVTPYRLLNSFKIVYKTPAVLQCPAQNFKPIWKLRIQLSRIIFRKIKNGYDGALRIAPQFQTSCNGGEILSSNVVEQVSW